MTKEDNRPDGERYPRVPGAQARVARAFQKDIRETGGNDPVDLMNDLANPESRMMRTNIVRFSLAVAVQAQVYLLMDLIKDGRLEMPKEDEDAE